MIKYIRVVNVSVYNSKGDCTFVNRNAIALSFILKQIEEEKKIIENLSSNFENSRKGKLVYAFTLDYFFAHYQNENSFSLCGFGAQHIFLDEAAYCPMIKAGILFSLGAPVTMFGDHMQLPPICEANEKTIHEQENNIFMWAQSALYFPELLDQNGSIQNSYTSFIKGEHPSSIALNTSFLKKTYRFGNNLASILNDHVYKNAFSGQDFNTSIIVIDAPRSGKKEELRENPSEAEAIKEYIETHKPNDCVIMAPYTAQRKLLIKTLHNVNRDNIVTVHASQGREWDTVILSVTDTHRKFFTDSTNPVSQGLKVINTAISRARKQLVIVCDREYWSELSDKQLIGKLVMSATEIIT